jgi:hypothetical protein
MVSRRYASRLVNLVAKSGVLIAPATNPKYFLDCAGAGAGAFSDSVDSVGLVALQQHIHCKKLQMCDRIVIWWIVSV